MACLAGQSHSLCAPAVPEVELASHPRHPAGIRGFGGFWSGDLWSDGTGTLLRVVNRPPFFRTSTEGEDPAKRSSQTEGNVSSLSTRSRPSFP
jgi:hypothetical protein